VPAGSWALGLYGLLGYHVVYFLAIKNAPPVEVSIISYLWPLLIVLFSGLLPASAGGTALRWWHIAGAALGFAGAALVPFARGGALELSGSATGYIAALAAALIWSSYSVASRLYAAVPSAAVTGTCALTTIGATLGHLLLEKTVWPGDLATWMVTAALGLGPVGIAFYLWDAGMKRGHLRLLGVLSYATPILSTVLLVLLGLGHGGPLIWLAVLLVTAGALLASAERFSGASRAPSIGEQSETGKVN
jgi:drug/metabolite transporter (DMT)-like permease